MSGLGRLIFDPTLGTAIAALAVGFSALWANPRRAVNRAFFVASVHVAVWLALLLVAVHVPANEGLPWLRAATSVGALFPAELWLIRAAICESGRRWSAAALIRAVVLVLLAALPLTYWFIPAHSTAEHRLYGIGYYVYIAGIALAYIDVGIVTLRTIKGQTGVKRLELKIVLIGGCIAAMIIVLLMMVRTLGGVRWLIGVQPVIVLLFYMAVVVAITRSRVFDARQLLLLAFKRLLLVTIVAALAYFTDWVLGFVVAEYAALFCTVATALWFATFVSGRLDRLFQFYPQAQAARQAAYAVIQRETRPERLEREFVSLLKGWGQADAALVYHGARSDLAVDTRRAAIEPALLDAMRALEWATPERLARERTDPERDRVLRLLTERGLGALVYIEGPAVRAIFGVGISASRRPYTYPQVVQLKELALIMEGAFERAHLTAKVQHAEQLATVGLLGASLAHEIRNPLVTIKTFVQLLPAQHQNPAFRDKFFRLIADEVQRIDQLTEQLLDLASPRTYSASIVELHPVVRASLDLVAAKAAHKGIELLAELHAAPDHVFTDAAAAKQVVLNLCFNAIQALDDSPPGARQICVRTRHVPSAVELSVSDTGPGIAPEILPRLFQPFQTTKSSGFGLGLAICSDILANLNASISVDPPMPGQGATFRVTFPCQPS